MKTVTISSKYQVVIPRRIRELFDLKPGSKLLFIPYKNSVRVVIVPSIDDAQGFVEGIGTEVLREREDRV